MKMHSAWRIATLALLFLAVAVNFYVFARVTVDDAFITWRYGENLIEAGIWGYNPTNFDLTQAYTNPIYAVLSIIPAFFHSNVVVFFKLLALATLALPFVLVNRRTADKVRFAQLYLLFFAMPATMVHVFAGLETFLFVILLGGLFIAVIETRFWLTNGLACALLFVRPEAWVLVGLVPAYVFMTPQFGPRLRMALVSFSFLGGIFALYTLFHYRYFGYVFPNTFYVKSGHALNVPIALSYLVYLLPALVLLLTPYKRVLGFVLLFYLPMVYCYSSSDLQMNFAGRFAFHLWAGIFWMLAYLLIMRIPGDRLFGKTVGFWCMAGILGTTLWLVQGNVGIKNMRDIANWAPHLLEVRRPIVEAINAAKDRHHIERIAMSDAGAVPYGVQLVTLDAIGLGSSLVAHQGMTDAVAEQYHPDLAFLVLRDGKVFLKSEIQLEAWLKTKKMRPLCEVAQGTYRSGLFYAREEIPELRAVCKASAGSKLIDPGRISGRTCVCHRGIIGTRIKGLLLVKALLLGDSC